MNVKKLTTTEMWNGWTEAYKKLQDTKGKCREVGISIEGCDDRTVFEWYVFESELEDLILLAQRCNDEAKNYCQPEFHIYEDLESAEHCNEDRKIC